MNRPPIARPPKVARMIVAATTLTARTRSSEEPSRTDPAWPGGCQTSLPAAAVTTPDPAERDAVRRPSGVTPSLSAVSNTSRSVSRDTGQPGRHLVRRPAESLVTGEVEHTAGVDRRSRARTGCPRRPADPPSTDAASWLFAAPATTRQRSRGTVSAFSTAPVAQGENRSHAVSNASSGSTIAAPTRSATAFARSATTSDTTSVAPASASRSQSGPPTPRPLRPRSSCPRISDPNACARLAADPVEHADRRVGRRRAGPAGCDAPTHHVRAPLADHVHVRLGGVHVARGDVAPAQRRDEVPVAPQQFGPCIAGGDRGNREHRLPSTERQAGHGVLERHRRREPQHIREGVVRRRRTPSSACRRSPARAPWSARRRTSRSRRARRSATRRTRRPSLG